MPELPEVEIIRQSLDRKIKLKKVKKVIVRNKNLRFKISSNFASFLESKKIIKVKRFSKYLIFCLSNESFCLLHLGMSGTVHLVFNSKQNSLTNTSFYSSPVLPLKHNHVEIIFKDFKIIYNDPRRFGFFQIIKDKISLQRRFSHIGIEPFNSKFNQKYIYSFFRNKEKNIKNFLLDQKFVSGIGNIYANEILYFCKINPLKKGKNINGVDIKKLLYFSKTVLKKAIIKGGSSIRDFKNTKGKYGSYQNEFKVYDRKNLNCSNKNCIGKIKKIIISNRSTFFCNNCQK